VSRCGGGGSHVGRCAPSRDRSPPHRDTSGDGRPTECR